VEVHLNAAVSLDGKLALAGGRPHRFSGPEDLARVHRLRADADAVLVGVGTVVADDPSLLAKAEHLGSVPERQPARVVLDPRLRTPPAARVLDGRTKTYLYATRAGDAPKGAEIVAVPAGPGGVALDAVVADLAKRGVRRLMVEGGGRVLRAFLDAGLADRFTLYVAPVVVGEAGAPGLAAGAAAADASGVLGLRLVAAERLGAGVLLDLAPRR